MNCFNFGNTTIEYTLYHNPLAKDITISVEWLEGVSVVAPLDISKEKLDEVLYKKAPWILKKWSLLNGISDLPAPNEFASGEKFLYLGRGYRLKVKSSDSIKKMTLEFYQGRFYANVPRNISDNDKHKQLSSLFKEWYIKRGQAKVNERLSIYCPKMDLAPQKIALKEQKMRWGTCTSEGAIYLNGE